MREVKGPPRFGPRAVGARHSRQRLKERASPAGSMDKVLALLGKETKGAARAAIKKALDG